MIPTAPLISVSIATYNRAANLDRAICSALAEPGDFFEVVVGDDASPDHTQAVIQAHRTDSRFRDYHNERNLGLQANVRKAAQAAQGDYIFILTDDDYLLPGALTQTAQMITAHPDAGYFLSHLPSVDERSGQILHWHRTFAKSGWHPAGLQTMRAIAGSAWVLSRQILRRDQVEWEVWERFGQNIFFPLIVAGRLLLRAPCYYLAEPLVMHTFFNRVFWDAFGRDQLEIEFNLAADRYRCMRAIVFDQSDSPAIRAAIEQWEFGNFATYLYQSHAGFYDLTNAIGRHAALQKLRAVYPLTGRQALEFALFPLKLPFVRAWVNIKSLLRRLPAPAVAKLRAVWDQARR